MSFFDAAQPTYCSPCGNVTEWPPGHLSKYAPSWQGEFRAPLRTSTGQSRLYEGRMR